MCSAAIVALALASLPAPASTLIARRSYPVVSRNEAYGVETFYRRSSVGWSFRTVETTLHFASTGHIPLMCDWNGDGTRTPGSLEPLPASQIGYLWFHEKLGVTTSEGTIFIQVFNPSGMTGATVFCGDFDGDGDDTLGFKNGNRWRLTKDNVSPGNDVVFTYGDVGDVGVVGDWDGNGTDTPAVVRVRQGDPRLVDFRWRATNTTGMEDGRWTTGRYGTGAFTPVVGNWNGTGPDGIGVVEGYHWQLMDGANSFYDFNYGYATDTALVG